MFTYDLHLLPGRLVFFRNFGPGILFQEGRENFPANDGQRVSEPGPVCNLSLTSSGLSPGHGAR